jgi:hypothetical protein
MGSEPAARPTAAPDIAKNLKNTHREDLLARSVDWVHLPIDLRLFTVVDGR